MTTVFRIGGQSKSFGSHGRIHIPSMTVTLPSQRDMGLQTMRMMRDHLQANLRTGRDAEGRQSRISDATYERRQRRPGSLKLRTAFVDTGKLINNLKVRARFDQVTLEVPDDRTDAADRLTNLGRPPLGLVPKVMDDSIRITLDKAVK